MPTARAAAPTARRRPADGEVHAGRVYFRDVPPNPVPSGARSLRDLFLPEPLSGVCLFRVPSLWGFVPSGILPSGLSCRRGRHPGFHIVSGCLLCGPCVVGDGHCRYFVDRICPGILKVGRNTLPLCIVVRTTSARSTRKGPEREGGGRLEGRRETGRGKEMIPRSKTAEVRERVADKHRLG